MKKYPEVDQLLVGLVSWQDRLVRGQFWKVTFRRKLEKVPEVDQLLVGLVSRQNRLDIWQSWKVTVRRKYLRLTSSL